jgi:hypothetical protein
MKLGASHWPPVPGRTSSRIRGGPGQIGIHGTNNPHGGCRDGSLHGCIPQRPCNHCWRDVSAPHPLTIARWGCHVHPL